VSVVEISLGHALEGASVIAFVLAVIKNVEWCERWNSCVDGGLDRTFGEVDFGGLAIKDRTGMPAARRSVAREDMIRHTPSHWLGNQWEGAFMRRGMWLVAMAGLVLATMAGWTSRGSAAPVEPVASPTVTGDCDAAIADMYTVLDVLTSNSVSWDVYRITLTDNTDWIILDSATLAAASTDMSKVADELEKLPLSSKAGKAFAKAITADYRGWARFTGELSTVESISDRNGIAALYKQPLSDLADGISQSLRDIRDLCGVERISFDGSGIVSINQPPVATPAATPTP